MENALTQLRGEMKGRIAGLEHATVAGAAAQAEDVSLPILRPQIEQLREANSRLGGAVMDLQARQEARERQAEVSSPGRLKILSRIFDVFAEVKSARAPTK